MDFKIGWNTPNTVNLADFCEVYGESDLAVVLIYLAAPLALIFSELGRIVVRNY